MAHNPLAARLARHSGWPSLSAAALIGAGMALSATALLIVPGYPYLTQTPSFSRALLPALVLLPTACYLFAFVSPAASAVIAARLASEEMRSGALDLLRLTALPRRDIILGYFRGALWRLRLLLAVAAGLMPAQVLGSMMTLLWSLQLSPAYYLRQEGWPTMTAMIFGQPLKNLWAWVAIPVCLWLCHAMAAAVGVSMAVTWRRGHLALSSAALITLAVMAGLHITILHPDQYVTVTSFAAAAFARPENYLVGLGRWTMWSGPGWVAKLTLILALAPALVAAGCVRLAGRSL